MLKTEQVDPLSIEDDLIQISPGFENPAGMPTDNNAPASILRLDRFPRIVY